MKYDLKKISSARCYLDIVKVFVDKVPVRDKEWKEIQKDAKKAVRIISQAMDLVSSISKPRPEQPDPCKGGPIIKFVA